jgi:hypothetical protein
LQDTPHFTQIGIFVLKNIPSGNTVSDRKVRLELIRKIVSRAKTRQPQQQQQLQQQLQQSQQQSEQVSIFSGFDSSKKFQSNYVLNIFCRIAFFK